MSTLTFVLHSTGERENEINEKSEKSNNSKLSWTTKEIVTIVLKAKWYTLKKSIKWVIVWPSVQLYVHTS